MGVDMEVPDFIAIRQVSSCSPLDPAESIFTPGARISGLIRPSDVGPIQENDARMSLYDGELYTDPTLNTFLALAGEYTLPSL